MNTINIDLYSLCDLLAEDFDCWTPPEFLKEWIDKLVSGHTLTRTAIVWGGENEDTGITLKGDIDAYLTANGHYEIPAGIKVSFVVTQELESKNIGPWSWSENDTNDMYSHQLGGVVTVH